MTPPDHEKLEFDSVETPAYVVQRIFDRLDDIEKKVDELSESVGGLSDRVRALERRRRCWDKLKAKLWGCTTELLSNWRFWAAVFLAAALHGGASNESLAQLAAALLGVDL